MTGEAYSIRKYIKIIFYAFVSLILAGFICAQIVYPSERDSEASEGNFVYEGILFWEKADGTKEQIASPGNYDVEPGEVMVISTILPEDYSENSIGIRGSQQTVRFYIEGELRSEYDTSGSRPFGSNSASRYVFCKTSAADAGKQLRIELKSNSKRYSGVVNQILCGDKTDIWSYIFSIYGGETVVACFILFAGIVTVLFSIALSIAYKSKINMVYLGWCIILGAAWLLGESKLRQLFVSNASSLASLCFIVIMLCPVPISLYVDSVQRGRYTKIYSILECVSILNLLLCNILQFAEIADYLDTLFASHVILISTFLVALVTFFMDFRSGKIKDYLLIVIGLLLAMVGAAIETVLVYFMIYTSGIFLGVGLLLLLLFAIIETIKNIRDMENQRQTEQFEKRRKQTEAVSLQLIQTLSVMIEAKDEYTKGHSCRVAEYSSRIAKELGWSDEEAENLRNAAYLHDIGKIGVPDAILNKPSKLLDAEYEIIKKHTTVGADILKNITLIQHVEEVARYHHERYDGSGYPEGLCGENIPIHARIVAVADSYDAMNSKRIYRNLLPRETIRNEILRNKGIQFDPDIADAFLRLFDENRMLSDEDVQNPFANVTPSEMLSKLEIDRTTETCEFISNVVDTLQSRRDAQSMDYLTGLPMRNAGEKQIAQSMQAHAGCLVFLDLDNMKKINDIYGHKSGDRVLKTLGSSITDCAKESIACRLGGDEFLIFLPDMSKDAATELVGQIFGCFNAKKENDVEICDATLSGGLCMSLKGDSFTECYAKADKALYYVKQNGKDNFSFFHQIEQNETQSHMRGKDLENVAKALRESGSYNGALDLDNREFSKMYEYVSNLGERYKHDCHLVMITMDAASDSTMFIEKIEQALDCMETAIRENIRNVDVCTRYSSMQYLVILMEAGEDKIPLILDRIFAQYYKIYNENDFRPHYEFMPMLGRESG